MGLGILPNKADASYYEFFYFGNSNLHIFMLSFPKFLTYKTSHVGVF